MLPKRSGQQLSENIHSGAINFHFLFKKCCISDLNFRSPAIIFGDISNTLAFLWCVPCSHSHTFTFNTLNCTSTFILASKPEDQASFLLWLNKQAFLRGKEGPPKSVWSYKVSNLKGFYKYKHSKYEWNCPDLLGHFVNSAMKINQWRFSFSD